MPLEKPPAVAADRLMSDTWDEATAGRQLGEAAVPLLELLCRWRRVAATAMDEMDQIGDQTAYPDSRGDLKQLPQVQTLKVAGGEIRRIMAQLGIEAGTGEVAPVGGGNVLDFSTERRKARRARAAG